MASANSALPKAIIIVRTTAAFHSMRHPKRAVPLRFVTVVYSSEIAIVMLSCGPSAWRTNRAGPASSAYARPARNAPTARSLYAVSRRSAWAPACAVAAPIAPSPHPASRRYLATRVRSFPVIGLFLTIALPSARYEATSSSPIVAVAVVEQFTQRPQREDHLCFVQPTFLRCAKQQAGTCHGLTVRVHRQCGFSPRRDYSYRAGAQPCVHAYR